MNSLVSDPIGRRTVASPQSPIIPFIAVITLTSDSTDSRTRGNVLDGHGDMMQCGSGRTFGGS
jgi:hypothetical protein